MKIKLTSLMVNDQVRAREFYTEKLGFVVKEDIPMGEFHWLIRVIHLLLGLLTIGMGHMAAARSRKTSSPEIQSTK